MAKIKDYYNILNITHSADESEVKQAYKTLARLHPENGELLSEAYNVLANPKKRSQYDQYMSAQNGSKALKKAPSASQDDETICWDYMTLESSKNYGTTKYYIDGDMKPELKNGLFINILKMLGSEGWEMVGISTVGNEQTFVFKRRTDEIYKMPGDGPAA